MGASASKPARSAVGAAARRQYPKKASPGTTKATPQQQKPQQTQPQQAGPTYHSNEQASSLRSEAIDLDARDPHFAASLRSIGPVTPNPTMSNSSTFHNINTNQPPHPSALHNHHHQQQQTIPSVFPDANTNPALLVLSSRSRIARAAEQELDSMGRQSHQGREFLDALTIRQVLSMRDRQGLAPGDIERLLSLKKGVVGRLGERGVVSEAV